MAKTIKINGIEEVKKLIEEGEVRIPGASFGWKTTRIEARPEHIDPKSAVLEARAGEDGIFRVERETIQEEELARLRSIVGKRIQKDIDELMRGMWENK